MEGDMCSLGQAPALETKNKEGMHEALHPEVRSLSPVGPGTDLSGVGAPKDSWAGICWGPLALERLETIWTTRALKMEHRCPA